MVTTADVRDYHDRPKSRGGRKTNDQLRLDLPDVPQRLRKGGNKAEHEDRDLQTHPQTRAKLDGYRGYLPYYLGKLGNTASHVFVNDLFAGSGRVRDGMGWADGSPVIACLSAASAATEFAARGRKVRFSLRFVEPHTGSRSTLEHLVEPFRDQLDIQVLPGRAKDHIEAILAESAGCPTITFLDPDGFGVTFEEVVAFSRPYGEVLLNFDVQGLLRTAGIVQTRSVSAFCGGDWWQEYRANGIFDEDGFLAEYGRRIGEVGRYHYVSASRLDFPEVHANRAIVQGAYSVKALDLWRGEMRKALPKHATVTFDFVAQLDRTLQVNGVLSAVPVLSRRRCYYGEIRRSLGILDVGEAEIHQALYYLRDEGFVTWTSTLHARSMPAPIFTFGTIPANRRWDEVDRPGERATRAGSLVSSRR